MGSKTVIEVVLTIVMCYLVGSLNISYFLSKLQGYDIRQHGSGNAGASNVIILMGKKTGFIVAIIDILKAYIVVSVTLRLFNNSAVMGAVAGTSVILGHIFPFYMGFRGGKGLATLGGTILAADPKLFVILLTIAIIMAVVINYICVVPMSMSVIFACIYGYTRNSLMSFLILMIAAVVMNIKHISNIKRIIAGTEARFSLLWNRKAEAERLGVPDDGGKGLHTVEGMISQEKH